MTLLTRPQQHALAALQSLFVADALAMPVHWYYNPMDIFRQFPGGITQLEPAPARHPSSIMSLHSTSKGGRGGTGDSTARREIVGEVILRGKRQFWNQPNQHYHQGMRAGENTLNAHCARALMRALANHRGHYDEAAFLDAYIDLLTADPPRHPDTYAESSHRGFFANLVAGKPRNRCGAVTHDTPSIGGLVAIAPIVIAERLRGTPLEEVKEICGGHLRLTHPDDFLVKVCNDYVCLLDALLFREESLPAQQVIAAWAKRSIGMDMPELLSKVHSDNDVIGRVFSSACYISDSWPSVLYLAYKYADRLRAGLLANTNLGGDNVHRGAVLGTLLGLATGASDPEFYAGLVDSDAISREINALVIF